MSTCIFQRKFHSGNVVLLSAFLSVLAIAQIAVAIISASYCCCCTHWADQTVCLYIILSELVSTLYVPDRTLHHINFHPYEKFEYTKGVTGSHKTKKTDNAMATRKKDKETNSDLQNTTQKPED